MKVGKNSRTKIIIKKKETQKKLTYHFSPY